MIELEDLKRLSQKIGRDPALVQGAGGNTSIKDREQLYVKASGFWLKDACERDMFVRVARDRLCEAITGAADSIDLDAYIIDGGELPLRPSIETTMHAILPHRVVVHTHSVNAIAIAIRHDAEAILGKKLAGLKWAWVAYARPGLPLTRKIVDVLCETPDILVLGNHGVVIGADDCAAAETLIDDVEQRLSTPLRAGRPADRARLLALAEGTGYRLPDCNEGHEIATDAEAMEIAVRGSLYPDHVVFLGPAAVTLPEGEGVGEWLKDRRQKGLENPAIILVAGVGLLARGDLSSGGEAMIQCLALVLRRTPVGAPINYLTPEDEQALLGWDAETYRKSLNL